jgi:hypothetical protein
MMMLMTLMLLLQLMLLLLLLVVVQEKEMVHAALVKVELGSRGASEKFKSSKVQNE